MGAAIGQILGPAVGVALSPIPIIAVILMLFTARARSNSVAFLAGWIVGLSVVGLVVLALGLEDSSGEESTASGVIKLVIGAVFVVLAWRNWSQRPVGDQEPEMPGWMAAIDEFTVPKSFGMAVVLSAVNPKNLGLTIAAASTISASGLSTGEEIGVLAVFVLLASVTVAVPVVAYLIRGSKAEARLNEMKAWLIHNNHTVMAVVMLVLGAKLIGDGLTILS